MPVFKSLIEAGVEASVVVVGDRTAGIIEGSGDTYRGVAITDAHQRGHPVNAMLFAWTIFAPWEGVKPTERIHTRSSAGTRL